MLDDRSYMRATRRPYWSVTTILLVSLAACFILQSILERPRLMGWHDVNQYFALSKEGLFTQHRFYQLITFQFMHAGLWHLLGNCIVIYFFGRPLENMLGGKGLLYLYLLSGSIGGLAQVALSFLLGPSYSNVGVVGASAGAFGLIAAFAISAPEQPITLLLLFVLPISFPAKVLLWLEALIALAGLFLPSTGDHTAHAAHLGGMLTGIVFIRWNRIPQGFLGGWRPFARRRAVRHDFAASATPRVWRRPRRKTDELPSGDFISREVDPILEKISAHGIHSLTERERQILEAARNKMAKR
jgi:membrane associated rhomboid family serine protease